jgi:hypothetical protein
MEIEKEYREFNTKTLSILDFIRSRSDDKQVKIGIDNIKQKIMIVKREDTSILAVMSTKFFKNNCDQIISRDEEFFMNMINTEDLGEFAPVIKMISNTYNQMTVQHKDELYEKVLEITMSALKIIEMKQK